MLEPRSGARVEAAENLSFTSGQIVVDSVFTGEEIPGQHDGFVSSSRTIYSIDADSRLRVVRQGETVTNGSGERQRFHWACIFERPNS
jgi:hypothetical protein